MCLTDSVASGLRGRSIPRCCRGPKPESSQSMPSIGEKSPLDRGQTPRFQEECPLDRDHARLSGDHAPLNDGHAPLSGDHARLFGGETPLKVPVRPCRASSKWRMAAEMSCRVAFGWTLPGFVWTFPPTKWCESSWQWRTPAKMWRRSTIERPLANFQRSLSAGQWCREGFKPCLGVRVSMFLPARWIVRRCA